MFFSQPKIRTQRILLFAIELSLLYLRATCKNKQKEDGKKKKKQQKMEQCCQLLGIIYLSTPGLQDHWATDHVLLV